MAVVDVTFGESVEGVPLLSAIAAAGIEEAVVLIPCSSYTAGRSCSVNGTGR